MILIILFNEVNQYKLNYYIEAILPHPSNNLSITLLLLVNYILNDNLTKPARLLYLIEARQVEILAIKESRYFISARRPCPPPNVLQRHVQGDQQQALGTIFAARAFCCTSSLLVLHLRPRTVFVARFPVFRLFMYCFVYDSLTYGSFIYHC